MLCPGRDTTQNGKGLLTGVSLIDCFRRPKWNGVPRRTPTRALPKMERRSKTDYYMDPARKGTAFQNGLLHEACPKWNGVQKRTPTCALPDKAAFQNGLLHAPCPKWNGVPKRTSTCTEPKMERRSKTDSYMHPAKKMIGVPKLDSMTSTHACKRVGTPY